MCKTVQCQVCKMYIDVDMTRAYSLRFVTEGVRHGAPRLEAVELGGREPWSGIRLVCKPCLAFLRGLDPPEEEVRLRRLLAAYVDSLDRAAGIVSSGDATPTHDGAMALRAVADDLRAILGSQEPEERDLPMSDCIPW